MLVVVDKCIERQAHGSQSVKSGAEVCPQVVAGTRAMVIVSDDWVLMPTRVIADAAKAAATRLGQGGQYRLHAIAESQIGETDNAGGHAGLATMFGVALRSEIGDELDLTDGTHLDRPVRPIVGTAFNEDGCFDVVAGSGIGQQLLDQIAPPLTP